MDLKQPKTAYCQSFCYISKLNCVYMNMEVYLKCALVKMFVCDCTGVCLAQNFERVSSFVINEQQSFYCSVFLSITGHLHVQSTCISKGLIIGAA